MNYEFPKMDLSASDAEWLKAVYSKVKKLEQVDIKELRVKLWDKVPRNFDPYLIDPRLIMSGSQITLLGIWHIDPQSRFLEETDR